MFDSLFRPPKNYRELLPKLSAATALTTFVYVTVLVIVGFVPKIAVDKSLVPPIKGYEDELSWALSFGVVPLLSAIAAWVLSRALEMHNNLAKLFQLRFYWNREFIVKPLRDAAGSDVRLDRTTVRRVMNEFYYKATKGIEQHYVEVFWHYALPFWIIFEHAIIVAISIGILWWLKVPHLANLSFWLAFVVLFGAVQFFAVSSRKSLEQVRQIPIQDTRAFFKTLTLVVRP
jgi:hypothetical protein